MICYNSLYVRTAIISSVFLFFALCARGSTIIGTDLPSNPIGTATVATAALDNGNCCTLLQSFTLSAAFLVNQLTLELGASDTAPFTVWLTDAEGPSTTVNNVLFDATQNFENGGAVLTSFTTSVLMAPGTYFLILSSPSTSLSQGWSIADSALPSPIESVGQNGSTGQGGDGSQDASFAPASTFVLFSGISTVPPSAGYAFQLDGTVVPEPRPAEVYFEGLLSLLAVLAMRRGRRSRIVNP